MIAYDYYMLTDLYLGTYMCSSLCPCTAYSNFDATKWGTRSSSLKNYIYTGSYTSFYTCLQDLIS